LPLVGQVAEGILAKVKKENIFSDLFLFAQSLQKPPTHVGWVPLK